MLLENRYEYNPNTDRIGKGGFGTVYKAWDKIESREVALKFVQKSKLPERYSLQEELKKVKDLSHHNLVRYYDFFTKSYENVAGEMDEMQIGVMEYINGGDLSAFMKMPKNTSKNKITLILRGILEGLAYLHERHFIHRDIKPQNILLQIENKQIIPKIADFSISKQMSSDLTSVSAAVGTYEYMSPEQLGKADAKLGITTDIWAFGVLAYHLFTQNLPFGSRRKGDTDGQIIANIMKAEIPELIVDLDKPFDEIITNCLQKNPKNRFQSTKEILALLPDFMEQAEEEESNFFSTQIPDNADSEIVIRPDTVYEESRGEDTVFSTSNALKQTQEDRNPKPVEEQRNEVSIESDEKESTNSSRMVLWVLGILLLFINIAVFSKYFTPNNKDILSKKGGKKQEVVEEKEEREGNLDLNKKITDNSSVVNEEKLNRNTEVNDKPSDDKSSDNSIKENDNNSHSYEIENGDNDIEFTYTHESPNDDENINNSQNTKSRNRRKKNKTHYDYVEEYISGSIVAKKGKYGYLNKEGKLIIPLKYDGFSNFSEGLAAVKYRGKWGFINKYGQTIIGFRYDRPGKFIGGKAHVELYGREIYINKKGVCVENCN